MPACSKWQITLILALMSVQYPLQLMMSMSALASSTFACEWLKSASENLNLSSNQKQVLNELPQVVSQQARKKYQSLLSAVENYSSHPRPKDRLKGRAVWHKGNIKLLDLGRDMPVATEAYALLVPSLINRYYILDLSEERSFVQYLREQGIYPLVLDWDDPGEVESGYDMADYVTEALLPALAFASRTTGSPVHLLGYCLGGLLSLAATQLAPEDVASLTLLATPWDFKSKDTLSPTLNDMQLAWVKQQMLSEPTLHPMMLEWLFMFRQPFAFEQKFTRLAERDDPEELEEFIQVEQWVNDNVPMASPAAVDCLIHWAQRNDLYRGKWEVAGEVIDPSIIEPPNFVAIPERDTIVPKQCAEALLELLPDAEACYPHTGHVGMMVSRNAREELWEEYVDFVLHRST